MTDNEIIEGVFKNIKSSKCLEPFETRDIIEQKDIKIAELTEEINQQKAEIERLQGYNENLLTANTALSNEVFEAKSEAIKEFAERLKEKFHTAMTFSFVFVHDSIDNLLAEMESGGQ